MSAITTHVLDVARGRPAAGVAVVLERGQVGEAGAWQVIGRGITDADGRVKALLEGGSVLAKGVHRITFATGAYFAAQDVAAFYPEVQVTFVVTDPAQHHHVPLLLSPFGYSTYRGS
jgi:5-hydroxyisourate hydrolase